MYNNIKSKALGVRKRSLLLVFLLIISMFTMVACDKNEEVVTTTQEFELVSCYVEFRNITNGFGGIKRTEKYFHYGYVDDNGKVIFDEEYFDDYLDLQLTDGIPKVLITTRKKNKHNVKTTYAFQLTREMYNNLNTSQK